MFKISPYFYVGLIALSSIFFFFQSFENFFFQDDFFNITLSQSQSITSAFNLFQRPIFDFYFYRPLTTQAFWGSLFPLFAFNPQPYHLVIFFFFALNIILVYKLTALLSESKSIPLLTTFLYAFSTTHFYRLFFLSQFQEIGLTTLVLLTVIFYLRKSWLSILFFALALASKETAVVTPILLFVLSFFFRRPYVKILTGHFLLLLLYLLLRFFFFGFASGGVYTYDLTPSHVVNNLFWYALWGLGIPESFVNLKLFLVSKYDDLGNFASFWIVNPDIFTSFGVWSGPIVTAFSLFFLTLLLPLDRSIWQKVRDKESLLGILIFIIFLAPVAFFPFHKFAYSLTIPAVGLSLFLANLISHFRLSFQFWSVVLFLALSFFTREYNLSEHWVMKKSYTAQKALAYFGQNYPQRIDAPNIYFRNSDDLFCATRKNKFLPSQEVAYGLGGPDSLRLFYNDPKLEVYFEDFDNNHHLLADSLMIDSRQFLQ